MIPPPPDIRTFSTTLSGPGNGPIPAPSPSVCHQTPVLAMRPSAFASAALPPGHLQLILFDHVHLLLPSASSQTAPAHSDSNYERILLFAGRRNACLGVLVPINTHQTHPYFPLVTRFGSQLVLSPMARRGRLRERGPYLL
ncbi:hypothetical protein C8Q76DRAFT_759873 [Earliella scabrosa]|nr:hypothetical protein C8Q76DRAFT_759873 [Earliella scabrosa]